jgi:hypothetical protein
MCYTIKMNTLIIGRIYHVVDKTTGEVVKVGSTTASLIRRFSGSDYQKKYTNHFLHEAKSIQSSEDDWYEKGNPYCPFLWHLVASEHMEIVKQNTFDKGPLSNKLSPLEQKYSGFDGSFWGSVGNLLLPREARIRGGHSAATKMRAEGKGIFGLSTEQRSKNGRKFGCIGGNKNVLSGHLQSISSAGGKISGAIQGRKLADNGHCARIAHLGGLAGGRKGGAIAGRKTAELSIGVHGLTKEQRISIGKKSAIISNHVRWHVNRAKPNPQCVLCSEESLVIAYA